MGWVDRCPLPVQLHPVAELKKCEQFQVGFSHLPSLHRTQSGQVAILSTRQCFIKIPTIHLLAPRPLSPSPPPCLQVSLVQDEEPSDLHKAGDPVPHVYALGDCCADLDQPLPALAQVGVRAGVGEQAQGRRQEEGTGSGWGTGLGLGCGARVEVGVRAQHWAAGPGFPPPRVAPRPSAPAITTTNNTPSAVSQVAEQQGKYLAKCLNTFAEGGQGIAANLPPFQYRHLGSMASVGGWAGVR